MLNKAIKQVSINGIKLNILKRKYDAIIEIPDTILKDHPMFFTNLCKRIAVKAINYDYKNMVYVTCTKP